MLRNDVMTQQYDSSRISSGIAYNLRCILASNWKQHIAFTRRLSLDNFKVEIWHFMNMSHLYDSYNMSHSQNSKCVIKMNDEISKKCRKEKFCLDWYGTWYCLSWIWIAWYSLCKIIFHLSFIPISPQFELLWPKFNLGATSNQTQSKPGFYLVVKRTSPKFHPNSTFPGLTESVDEQISPRFHRKA